ncbi:MAG TPA: hypothetical protein VMV45_21415 [Casimicrobiaceae bacterium]|nr:hypothetical protein [Casimicrobiaceae bacterium]
MSVSLVTPTQAMLSDTAQSTRNARRCHHGFMRRFARFVAWSL